MPALFAIIRREFRLFFSNKIMLVLYLGGPILYGFIFNAVYRKGKVSDLPVVVVDKDGSRLSRQLIDMIDDNDVTNVSVVLHESVELNKLFIAEKAYAVVEIPYRFQADVLQGRMPEVLSYINNTDLLPSGYVSRSLTLVTGTFNTMLAAGDGRVRGAMAAGTGGAGGTMASGAGGVTGAFRVNTYKLFNPSSNYAQYIWPSYLAIVLQSVIMVVLALSFSGEFEQGTMGQLTALSRGRTGLILWGKLLPYMVLSVVTLLIFRTYFMLFRQQLPGDTAASLSITLLFMLSSASVGIITGVLIRRQLPCLQFLMVLSMPVYISSGFSWPLEETGLPSRIYSALFPFMAFVNGWRILLTEHGHLSDIRDLLVIQGVQLMVYLSLAFRLIKSSIRNK